MGVHFGRDIKAFGRSIVGGRSGTYEQEFGKAVREAKQELRAAAEALDADASQSRSTTRKWATRC